MRSLLILDMSFTLDMYKKRQLEQALEIRKLGGYFDKVISVHPLAGLFRTGTGRFGDIDVTWLDDAHVFVEGKIGITSRLYFLPPLNFLLAQVKLIRLLLRLAKETHVDVVRIGDPYYLGILGWILSRLLRVPLAIRVCSNYDLLCKTTRKAIFPRLFIFRSIEKIIERFVLPRCELVAGANQNNLDYAIANGALPETGVVFRYGNLIHPVHFSEPSSRLDGKRLLQESGIADDFIATISRLEEMKQSDQNLLVMKRLMDRGYDIKFIYIGDGSMRKQLEHMVEELDLSGQIIFVGNQSQEWIANVLPLAHLVLSPHMGRGLTEACLAGAPIVAYDYDWQGELIHSGETGMLVPDNDWEEMAEQAAELLDNREKAQRLGKQARRYTMEIMDPDVLSKFEVETYEALLNKRSRRCADSIV